MADPIGLAAYRWSSNRKSLFLIGLYPLVTIALFWVQIFLILLISQDFSAHSLSERTTAIFFDWIWVVVSALSAWLAYSWHHQAEVIERLCSGHLTTAAEEPRLYAILESVCISQGLATPELEILESHARNSFVCAVDDTTYRLFITRGLLEALQADEIEAVIAHEVSHILHGDTQLLGLSIAFSDLFPFISNAGPARTTYYTQRDAEEQAGQFLIFLHPVIFILLLPFWGGYFATSMIRVFLFVNRELDADASAYEITKNADALMRALIRINRRAMMPRLSRDIRFLCIGNPKGGFFATHPRLSKRLKMLSLISGTPIPEIEESSMAPIHQRFQENPLLKRVFRPAKPNVKPPSDDLYQ